MYSQNASQSLGFQPVVSDYGGNFQFDDDMDEEEREGNVSREFQAGFNASAVLEARRRVKIEARKEDERS